MNVACGTVGIFFKGDNNRFNQAASRSRKRESGQESIVLHDCFDEQQPCTNLGKMQSRAKADSGGRACLCTLTAKYRCTLVVWINEQTIDGQCRVQMCSVD